MAEIKQVTDAADMIVIYMHLRIVQRDIEF